MKLDKRRHCSILGIYNTVIHVRPLHGTLRDIWQQQTAASKGHLFELIVVAGIKSSAQETAAKMDDFLRKSAHSYTAGTFALFWLSLPAYKNVASV